MQLQSVNAYIDFNIRVITNLNHEVNWWLWHRMLAPDSYPDSSSENRPRRLLYG